jgi:hypothetical protein
MGDYTGQRLQHNEVLHPDHGRQRTSYRSPLNTRALGFPTPPERTFHPFQRQMQQQRQQQQPTGSGGDASSYACPVCGCIFVSAEALGQHVVSSKDASHELFREERHDAAMQALQQQTYQQQQAHQPSLGAVPSTRGKQDRGRGVMINHPPQSPPITSRQEGSTFGGGPTINHAYRPGFASPSAQPHTAVSTAQSPSAQPHSAQPHSVRPPHPGDADAKKTLKRRCDQTNSKQPASGARQRVATNSNQPASGAHQRVATNEDPQTASASASIPPGGIKMVRDVDGRHVCFQLRDMGQCTSGEGKCPLSHNFPPYNGQAQVANDVSATAGLASVASAPRTQGWTDTTDHTTPNQSTGVLTGALQQPPPLPHTSSPSVATRTMEPSNTSTRTGTHTHTRVLITGLSPDLNHANPEDQTFLLDVFQLFGQGWLFDLL